MVATEKRGIMLVTVISASSLRNPADLTGLYVSLRIGETEKQTSAYRSPQPEQTTGLRDKVYNPTWNEVLMIPTKGEEKMTIRIRKELILFHPQIGEASAELDPVYKSLKYEAVYPICSREPEGFIKLKFEFKPLPPPGPAVPISSLPAYPVLTPHPVAKSSLDSSPTSLSPKLSPKLSPASEVKQKSQSLYPSLPSLSSEPRSNLYPTINNEHLSYPASGSSALASEPATRQQSQSSQSALVFEPNPLAYRVPTATVSSPYLKNSPR